MEPDSEKSELDQMKYPTPRAEWSNDPRAQALFFNRLKMKALRVVSRLEFCAESETFVQFATN